MRTEPRLTRSVVNRLAVGEDGAVAPSLAVGVECRTDGANMVAQHRSVDRIERVRRRLDQTIGLLKLLGNPNLTRPDLTYNVFTSMGEKSEYLSMGYWKNAETFDQAGQDLVHLVADTAGVGPGHRILDVGFGFGDQDLYIHDHFSPARIDGINITPLQVDTARRKVAERGLEDVIRLAVGSATALPFEANTFDAVLALESPMHFDTRETFFHEALRVLRPGGKLVTADMIPMPGRRKVGLTRMLPMLAIRIFWQSPGANRYPRTVYEDKLRAAGFADAEVRSIREDVYPPFARFIRPRLDDPEIVARVHPLIRAVLKWQWGLEADLPGEDYVLASARKPVR